MPCLQRRTCSHFHGRLGIPPKQKVSCLSIRGTVGVLIMAGVLLGVAEGSRADTQGPDIRATLIMLQPGEVTANYGTEILIDNKRYTVLPSVTVSDDEGQPRDLKEAVPGTQVRFHLRKDGIDQLVIMMPR